MFRDKSFNRNADKTKDPRMTIGRYINTTILRIASRSWLNWRTWHTHICRALYGTTITCRFHQGKLRGNTSYHSIRKLFSKRKQKRIPTRRPCWTNWSWLIIIHRVRRPTHPFKIRVKYLQQTNWIEQATPICRIYTWAPRCWMTLPHIPPILQSATVISLLTLKCWAWRWTTVSYIKHAQIRHSVIGHRGEGSETHKLPGQIPLSLNNLHKLRYLLWRHSSLCCRAMRRYLCLGDPNAHPDHIYLATRM